MLSLSTSKEERSARIQSEHQCLGALDRSKATLHGPCALLVYEVSNGRSKHPSRRQAECHFPVWNVSGNRHIPAGALHAGLPPEPKCSHLQPFMLHGL